MLREEEECCAEVDATIILKVLFLGYLMRNDWKLREFCVVEGEIREKRDFTGFLGDFG